jgi:hypothetical protein
MAVRIPTREVIPIAIISAVRMERNKFAEIDLKPSEIFTIRFMKACFL